VKENIEVAVQPIRNLLNRFDELSTKLGEDLTPEQMDKVMAEHGRVQDEIEAKNAWDLDNTLERAMDALRCPPGDWPVTNLSGGERRRVALCRLLLERPDLLLLDEPTNHLDAESVAWLERHLAEYTGTVVAVTHDRYFLDNVAGWILELDRGNGIPWQGNYSSWLDQKKKRLEAEEKGTAARQRTLEQELEWVRQSPRARQAKSKARLKRYEELLAQDDASRIEKHEIAIPPGPRLGANVIEFEGVSKSYGDKLLFEVSDVVSGARIRVQLRRLGLTGADGVGQRDGAVLVHRLLEHLHLRAELGYELVEVALRQRTLLHRERDLAGLVVDVDLQQPAGLQPRDVLVVLQELLRLDLQLGGRGVQPADGAVDRRTRGGVELAHDGVRLPERASANCWVRRSYSSDDTRALPVLAAT
jgi:ATPase subunit of ABC transporter with duplicated ATPase domains